MMTTRRTYSREDWLAAQEAWRVGDFSAEWKGWRHLAAMEASILFPPDGSALDSWDEDHPSQRAILIRAIRETPKTLRRAIRGARSWGQVIERLIPDLDILRAERADDERQAAYRRGLDEPDRIEAMSSVGAILRGVR